MMSIDYDPTEIFKYHPGVLRGLRSDHSSPDRHYHNWEHVESVCSRVRELVGAWSRPLESLEPLYWAALFHDVVYDSRSSNSEERSVQKMKHYASAMGKTHNDGHIHRAAELIMETKGHWPKSGDRLAHILCDADLWILGSPHEEYLSYSQAIREEYSWVKEAEYSIGRMEVLSKMLSRSHIYFLDMQREKQARINMRRERDHLKYLLDSVGKW